MFNFLVTRSLRHRLFVLAASLCLIAYGAWVLPRIPIDVLPDLTRPTVTVMTEAEGLAPAEVEPLVTRPIENLLNGIPGVETVRSVSGVGYSMVMAEFGWETDITLARIRVNERLATVRSQLPSGIVPEMTSLSSIMGEIFLIAVTAEAGSATHMELREIADFVLRPQLLSVSGVTSVRPIGGEVRQYRVVPDPVAMRSLDVSLDTIKATLRSIGTNTPGGFVEHQSRELLVRNVGHTTSIDDIRGLAISAEGGQTVYLAQVAHVDFAARPKRGDAGFNGQAAVILSVEKQPGADTLALTRAIESLLGELQKTMSPGVRVDQVQFRQATFIEQSIANLQKVLIEAFVVVALVLLVFLMNWRATVISLTAIPIAILFTVVVFQIMDLTINTMTLGGIAIAIGELVDDAVVDVENILRRLKENVRLAEPMPALEVISAASQEVRSGIVYATLIIVLVFLPLFALSGIEGRLITPLGIAYIVSILGSLITSITLTPVLAHYLLSGQAKRLSGMPDGVVLRALKRWTRSALEVCFARPAWLAGAMSAAIVLAVAGAILLPRAFLPAFNEGTLLVGIRFQPGISLGESNRLGLAAERLILEVPDVLSVGRRTGRAEADLHAEGVHAGEVDVNLRAARRPLDEIMADIREKLAVLPASVVLGQPISHRIEHLLSGVRAAIAVKIFGPDLDTLRTLAESVRKRLATVPGLVDLQSERQAAIPTIRVQVDHQRAQALGIKPQSVTEQLQTLSNGEVVSRVVDGERRFDVVLRLGDESRTVDSLRDLLLPTPAGFVPVRMVADVDEVDGPNQVLRENGQRRIVVFGNIEGGADASAVAQGIREALPSVAMPAGYRVVVEGMFRAQEESTRLIGVLAIVSAALIFLVLYTRYQSAVLAAIVMGNIPLALVGSVIALHMAGLELSVASMVGFITLAGISARNGILKISHYINLALNEGERFGTELVIRGSLERLSPVLMTALSASLALVPLLFIAGKPGSEILHPVAVTIFGGLISATLLDTFATPTLFLKFGDGPLQRLLAQHQRDRSTKAAY